MRLLVCGSARVDAGKTTFSVGLCHRLGAPGYKPRAGNDYWFDHDDYRRAIDEGRLYGKDVHRLAAVSPGTPAEETLNPVHRLWTPAPSPKAGLLGREDREFLCDRVTDDGATTFVVNGTADLPASARDALPLDDAVVVTGIEELNDAMERYHLPALASVADRIASEERVVVESYGDIARPLREFQPDAVAVVEPCRARVYGGQRWDRACQVASGSAQEGRLEELVPTVTDLLDPLASTTLPALTGAERDDPAAVADAYEHAYEALVAAAIEK